MFLCSLGKMYQVKIWIKCYYIWPKRTREHDRNRHRVESKIFQQIIQKLEWNRLTNITTSNCKMPPEQKLRHRSGNTTIDKIHEQETKLFLISLIYDFCHLNHFTRCCYKGEVNFCHFWATTSSSTFNNIPRNNWLLPNILIRPPI